MKAGATIETERLFLRHWVDKDLDPFFRLNSDQQIMQFFPFRRSREEAAQALGRFRNTVAEDGFGWCAVTLKSFPAVIGFSGLSMVDFEAPFTPAVEIDWRFLPKYWGNGCATEAARALVAHGFTELELLEIVSFAVPANTASTAVMERIGMRPEPAFDFDMPGIADNYAHLRRHVFYRLTRKLWERSREQD